MNTLIFPNAVYFEELRRMLSEGEPVKIPMKGHSMRPFLEGERDKAVIERIKAPIKKHDVVLAEVQPRVYVLHRVIRVAGNSVTLMGDGNIAATEQCEASHVVGIATAFLRKGRTHPDYTDSLKWKVYSACWTSLLPLRRWLLAFYRRIWLRLFPIRLTPK